MWILLLVLGLAYAGICALLFFLQDRMVFPGAGRGDRGLPEMALPATIEWIGPAERRTRVMIVASRQPVAVMVYFGGNGEDLFASAWSVESLASWGATVIGVEHPGYGASGGTASGANLLANATAAVAFARARALAAGVPLIVVGSSLGTFCAVHVAAAGGADKLLLRSPPTTLAAAAKQAFWWLPVGMLLRHRFDSLALAANVRCPVLVVHGDQDEIVPPTFGRELAAALHAQFVLAPGCGHNDLDLSPNGPSGGEIRAFLASR